MSERFSRYPGTWPEFISWPTALIGIVAIKAALSLAVKPGSFLVSYSGISYFLLLVLATSFAVRNAIQNTLRNRPFWVLLAIAYGLWAVHQSLFLFYEIGLHTQVPENSISDPVLFLHVVPLLAAVTTLPYWDVTGHKLYRTILDALLLLFFWGFLYVYAVLPHRYLFSNPSGYALRFDALYLAENLALVLTVSILSLRAQAPWKAIELHLLGACSLYAISSGVANLAIDSGGYVNGKLYGLGLTAAVCWFVWIPLRARQAGRTEVSTVRREGKQDSQASGWAMLVVLLISIPIGWELFQRDQTSGVRTFRLLVAVSAIVGLAGAAYLKEHFVKSDLAARLSLVDDRLREAMKSGKVVGWEWDIRTGQDTWFGDLKTIFGIESDTCVGSTEDFYLYVHPEDRRPFFDAITQAKEKHTPYSIEFRVAWQDGTIRWVAASGKFQYSAKGQPERMLGTGVDITGRKLLELELQQSQARNSAVVASAMDAIIATDASQKIVLFNAAAEKMFDCPSQDAVGSPIERFIPQRFRAAHSTHIRQFGQTGSSGRAMGALATLWGLKASGEEFPIEASISHSNVSGKLLFTVIIRDVTERHRAEEALRESEERFRLVANSAPVLIWMSGKNRLCSFVNQRWLEFTGRTLEQELGGGWTVGVHPDDLEHRARVYSDAFDSQADFKMEFRLRRFDGEYRWLADFGSPRFEADGTFCGYVGSCVDITERKRSEESLHSLTGRFISAQEEERARIARELHDDFSQRLALLGIGMGQLWNKLLSTQAEERTSILEMLKETKEMSSDMHALSHQLHSSKLEHVGLAAALHGLCKEISEKYGIEVHFSECECPSSIPKDVALCLFRVAQEALGNVSKHSGAKEATVELRANAYGLSLRVSDRGKGFNPENSNVRAGIGLVGMTERLRLVGGRFVVKSKLNCGTELLAEAPLAAADEVLRERTHAAGK
jgi:PAS domain S-box-containing protein